MINILMTNSENDYLKSVVYFDNNGTMKTADFSNLKIKSDDIDFEKLARQIEVIEYENKREQQEDIQDFIDSFGDTNGTENITKDITKTTDNFER